MNCEKKSLDTIINLIDTKYFNTTTGILTIPNGVEEIKGKFYFRRKDKQKLNKIKQIKIPDTVQKIGKYAFRRTGITELELPNSIKEIELGAFELCKDLICVTVKGNNIPLIEHDSFIACELLESFRNDAGEIDVKNDLRISNKAFSTCYKLLNKQNKWLLVVPERENTFRNIVNKFLKLFTKIITFNGADNIKDKF